MIGILDYGVGNIGAFIRIYHNHNIEAMPIKECDDFKHVKKIILPGVGSFDSAMKICEVNLFKHNISLVLQ